MSRARRLTAHRIASLLVILPTLVAQGAEFRNFNLPCLAPLLKQVDSEAPSTVNVAFLRGPWHAPQLRNDIGKVHLPITTVSEQAAAWFDQGVALLHGQAYAEAERSFRQALVLDPENPMIFWGLSIANEQRPGRARLFAQNAVRRVGNATTARERLWIDTLAHFHAIKRNGPAQFIPAKELTTAELQARHHQRIRDMEAITLAFPAEIEAKAFLLRQLTLDKHRFGIPITSHVAVDRLALELEQLAPAHPSRHYRIFLWLGERPRHALSPAETSASLAPGLADSWRFAGEAWRANGLHFQASSFLEAALRVHHRNMIDRNLMPAQLENLASNYTAHIESLAGMGRIEEALTWSQRMLALPRSLAASGDGTEFTLVGRRLVVETLLRAELPARLLDEFATDPNLQPNPASPRERAHDHYWKGLALATLGRFDELAMLEEKLAALLKSLPSAIVTEECTGFLAALKSFGTLSRGEIPQDFSANPPHVPLNLLAGAWAKAGRRTRALELAKRDHLMRPGELFATAAFCEQSFAGGEFVPAMAAFNRPFRENALRADPGLPALDRLAPLAARMQLPKRWKIPAAIGDLPGLPREPAALGPLTWTPAPAPHWSLPNHTGRPVSLEGFKGQAVLLNFFLGVSCPYCVTQLDRFRPHLDAYKKAGITMVAISTDSVETLELRLGKSAAKTPQAQAQFPYLIVADPELSAFKNYGVFDDFENGPMHATFLIGPRGRILWSDVGHEPFNRPEPLLGEAKRLLKLHSSPENSK